MSEQTPTSSELDQAWQKLTEQKFSNNKIKKQEIMDAIKTEAHSSILDLKSQLKTKLMFSTLFTIMFFGFAFTKSDAPLLYYGMTVLYLFGTLMLFYKYRQMGDGLEPDKSILANLKHNASAIKSMLLLERIWGIMACVAVFIYFVSDSIKFNDDERSIVIRIGIFLVIMVVLGFIAEYFNKIKFGNKLKEMEDNIIRLETLS